MSSPTQLSLTSWTPPVARSDAPEGIKRAEAASRGVDPAILRCAPGWVGREVPIPEAHAEVQRVAGTTFLQDTVRRRLNALRDMGLVALGEPTKTGHILVLWTKP